MENEPKYKLGEKHPTQELYRVVALRDFGHVKAGEVGGWVASEANLSQRGLCWVARGATVKDDALVEGDAYVGEQAVVAHRAKVTQYATVFGQANVLHDALVGGEAKVLGHARVQDNGCICGKARLDCHASLEGMATVDGNAWVTNSVQLKGDARIDGDAKLTSNNDYLVIGPLGRSSRFITITKSDKVIRAGCFRGDFSTFKKRVRKEYPPGSAYEQTFDLIGAYLGERRPPRTWFGCLLRRFASWF